MTKHFQVLLAGLFLAVGLVGPFGAQPARAAGPLKVAVTDLAYEERVREYFRNIQASSQSSLKVRARESERESEHSGPLHDSYRYNRRASGSLDARSSSSYSSSEGTYSYIDRGELRKFTADIKGEMLKSGYFQVTQAKLAKDTDRIYDIIARIKKGQFPNAKYVLFGSVSNIAFRQEENPIDHTDTVSHTLSLELVADFSLINTKTYEVKSAFSAMGVGQDVKLMSSAGGRVVLNRSKVISEVSKTLGEDVIRQLEEQLASLDDNYVPIARETVVEHEVRQKEEVIIFK
jgi:curli biogenesis system outer membrane secretion channel CsgG